MGNNTEYTVIRATKVIKLLKWISSNGTHAEPYDKEWSPSERDNMKRSL